MLYSYKIIERLSLITEVVDSLDQSPFCGDEYDDWLSNAEKIIKGKYTQIYPEDPPYDLIPGEVYDYAYVLSYFFDENESIKLALKTYLNEMQINYDPEKYQVPIENLINNWDEEAQNQS